MESFYRALSGHGSCLGLILSWTVLIFLSGCLYTLAGYVGPALGAYLDRLGTLGTVIKYGLLVLFFLMLIVMRLGSGKRK